MIKKISYFNIKLLRHLLLGFGSLRKALNSNTQKCMSTNSNTQHSLGMARSRLKMGQRFCTLNYTRTTKTFHMENQEITN